MRHRDFQRLNPLLEPWILIVTKVKADADINTLIAVPDDCN